MKTNCFNVMIHVKCVPGDDHKAISEELEDVLMSFNTLRIAKSLLGSFVEECLISTFNEMRGILNE